MRSNPMTHTLGYPRTGGQRELKKATEAYWAGKLNRSELETVARSLRRENWLIQQRTGIDLIPSNDFSFYDQILDTTCLVGNIPPRFGWSGGEVDLDTRFSIARGVRASSKDITCACPTNHALVPTEITFASEMTKWFDTNYHYIVPEFRADTQFALSATKVFDEFSEALALGIKTKPVLTGPVTYLTLGKVHDPAHPQFNRLDLLERLLPVYIQVLQRLESLGAEWVQFDEPVFALDLSTEQRSALATTYATIASVPPKLKHLVASYFGGLRDNLRDFLRLPVHALHVYLVRAPREIAPLVRECPEDKVLSLGVVDGRNIWRSDFAATLPILEKAVQLLGSENVFIAPSCSLQHTPVSLQHETKLDSEFKSWLAFAEDKLAEVVTLRDLVAGLNHTQSLPANRLAIASRRASSRIH